MNNQFWIYIYVRSWGTFLCKRELCMWKHRNRGCDSLTDRISWLWKQIVRKKTWLWEQGNRGDESREIVAMRAGISLGNLWDIFGKSSVRERGNLDFESREILAVGQWNLDCESREVLAVRAQKSWLLEQGNLNLREGKSWLREKGNIYCESRKILTVRAGKSRR